jgi:hypothetical protein
VEDGRERSRGPEFLQTHISKSRYGAPERVREWVISPRKTRLRPFD